MNNKINRQSRDIIMTYSTYGSGNSMHLPYMPPVPTLDWAAIKETVVARMANRV